MIERLLRQPRRFGFFQALRLLEREQRRRSAEAAGAEGGGDFGARWDVEPALFRAEQSLAFPSSEIAGIRPIEEGRGRRQHLVEMVVSFFGLTGPSGVLPQHYTSLIISMRSKSRALRDFFDLFNHRLILLFADTWAKYRLPIAFERSRQPTNDPISTALRAIGGFSGDAIHGSKLLADRWVLYYGGLFAHTPRCAAGLEAMLGDYFRLPVTVQQFRGKWLTLGAEDWTALPSSRNPRGSYCQLDENATLGDRVWDVQSCFRIGIGPLDYAEFIRFMPAGIDVAILLELANLYVGCSLDFDVQLTLRREQVPACRLAMEEDYVPQLGWNTWLHHDARHEDASDAVFGGEAIAI
jgi:type VI secretion system protein ImpH